MDPFETNARVVSTEGTGDDVTTERHDQRPDGRQSSGQSRQLSPQRHASSDGITSVSSLAGRGHGSGRRGVSLKERLLRQVAHNWRVVSVEGTDDDISIEDRDGNVIYQELGRVVSPQPLVSQSGGRQSSGGRSGESLKEQPIDPNLKVVSAEGMDDNISIEGNDESDGKHESRRVSPQRQASEKGDN